MADKRNARPAFLKDMVANQPQAFKDSYANWKKDSGILSALEAVNMPFEASGQYFGNNTLDQTGSPAAATAAYMAGSGVLGTLPLKGAQKIGFEGLRMLDDGITHGSGPLSGLNFLAPGVMKREGGNWFPGEIERQVYHMQGRTPNKDISDWIAGPMKNYIQKRFASPNDEIRKLYDQDIAINPPVELGYNGGMDLAKKRIRFADPSLPSSQMASTDAGKNWENRADNMITPDTELLDAAKASFPMPKYLNSWSPEERIGAETLRYLRRKDASNVLPPEVIGQDITRQVGASKEAAGSVAAYIKENRNILKQLRESDTVNPTTWGDMHDNSLKFGWDAPETEAARLNASKRGTELITRRTGKALDEAYAHLDQPAGTLYSGLGFKYGNNLRYNPFSGQDTTLDIIRNNFGNNAPWLANVPADNPVNSFENIVRNYPRGSKNIAHMPEFEHMLDVMNEDFAAGRLTPQQLKSGAFSVEAAARRAAEYNAEKIKAMEKTKLIEAEGFPTIKQYDDGYKWLELKHKDNPGATKRALSEEGNAMGHCVGGYCDRVLAGNTRIISLRNAKGQPRVTIELSNIGNGYKAIEQIKGPANRKPSAAEIPMIQDFIKNNGPWHGRIGDFHNTDLLAIDDSIKELTDYIRRQKEHRREIYQPYTDMHTWMSAEQKAGKKYADKKVLLKKYQELSGNTDVPPFLID